MDSGLARAYRIAQGSSSSVSGNQPWITLPFLTKPQMLLIVTSATSTGNKEVSSPPRFKEKEHRPHLLRGMSRSFCRRAGWMGNIVATIFGKYNLPQPLRTKQHPSLWINDFVNHRVQWSISVSGRARKQSKTKQNMYLLTSSLIFSPFVSRVSPRGYQKENQCLQT